MLSYTPSEKVLKANPKSEAMLLGKFKAMNFLQRSEYFAENREAKMKQKHYEELTRPRTPKTNSSSYRNLLVSPTASKIYPHARKLPASPSASSISRITPRESD